MELKAFIEITRPHNCILAGIVGVLGSVVALGGIPEFRTAILIFLVVTLGCAGGNTVNDYFDYEIDKINRPERPLPRGAMERKTALRYAIALLILGLILSYMINMWAFILAVVAYGTMLLYAWKLKPMPFVGNLTVAALTGATPLYGAAGVGKLGLAGYLAICAFLVNVSREIMKDIEDIEGDTAKGARTLPIVWGIRRSAYLAVLFAVLTVLASFLPVKAGIGAGYAPMVLVDGLILWAAYLIIRKPLPETAGKTQKMLKISIFLAVFTFLIASIWR